MHLDPRLVIASAMAVAAIAWELHTGPIPIGLTLSGIAIGPGRLLAIAAVGGYGWVRRRTLEVPSSPIAAAAVLCGFAVEHLLAAW